MALHGIDVSTWQPANITDLVDYDFAIMKASEGLAVAKNCDAQYQRAKKRGKLVGVYHFASPGDPIAQADFFVKHVKGYVGEAILVLDLEAAALTQWGPSGAKKWMDRVYSLTGVRPVLYVMGSAVSRFGNIAGADYGLWIANWNKRTTGGFTTPPKPGIGPWKFAALHQYTDRGHLKGYSSDLDLNIFHGDRNTWLAYAGAKKSDSKPKPKPEKPSKPKPKPAKKAPAFPLPKGSYFGPKEGPAQSVSGYYSHRADLKKWQAQMKSRGWSITVDGLYGPQTRAVATEFQRKTSLRANGLIGPTGWRYAWEYPLVKK